MRDACMRAGYVIGGRWPRVATPARGYRRWSRRYQPADQLRLPRQILGDVLLVRFQRAAADLEQLGVAPQALDDVLAHVAVAAEHLDGAVGDLLADAGGEELGAVGVDAVAVAVEVEPARRVVDVAARRLVLGVGLGDVALDLAVLADRHAERLALVGVARP